MFAWDHFDPSLQDLFRGVIICDEVKENTELRMKRYIAGITAVFALVCFFCAPSFAEERKIRVKLEVLGDQSVDQDADKLLKRSLAVLKDVELVDADPQVYVHVMARRIVTNTGRNIGYVMSMATAEILDMDLKDGSAFTCSDYAGLWLETGPDLRGLCEKCVLAVDYGVFSKIRKILGSHDRERK